MKIEEVQALFTLANIPINKSYELKNKYWPDSYVSTDSWWLVTTPYGNIEIGWRKRVLSIDWSETKLRYIITQDQVTKEETMVHAWSYAKAVEYLTVLSKELKVSQGKGSPEATKSED